MNDFHTLPPVPFNSTLPKYEHENGMTCFRYVTEILKKKLKSETELTAGVLRKKNKKQTRGQTERFLTR